MDAGRGFRIYLDFEARLLTEDMKAKRLDRCLSVGVVRRCREHAVTELSQFAQSCGKSYREPFCAERARGGLDAILMHSTGFTFLLVALLH